MEEYTCNDLDKIYAKIEELKVELLFNFVNAGMAPIAEQQYLAAISYLQLAVHHTKLAHFHQIKGE